MAITHTHTHTSSTAPYTKISDQVIEKQEKKLLNF